MKFNRIILFLAFPALFALSCQREQVNPKDDILLPGESGKLSLRVSTPGGDAELTKSATLDREKLINDYSIMVFGTQNGLLERITEVDSYHGDATNASYTLTVGDKTAWVYANYPVDRANVSGTLPIIGADLALNDFEGESFPMRAYKSGIMIEKDATTNTSMTLERVASRVVISSIKNNLPSNINVTIVGAYLSDVLTEDHGWGDPSLEPRKWITKWGRDSEHAVVTGDHPGDIELSRLTAWFDSSDGLPYVLTNGSTYSPSLSDSRKGPRFYFIPGVAGEGYRAVPDLNDLVDAKYTPLETKLVVVTKINGQLSYYPIPIRETRSNISREYAITLTNVGSPDPALPCETGAFTVNGKVSGWEDGPDYDENSDGKYRLAGIARTGSRQGKLYVAQVLTMDCDVSETIAKWKNKIEFSVKIVTPEDETIYDNTSLKATYKAGENKWVLSYPCTVPGDITITAKDPEGREIGTYSAPVSKIPQYQITSNASTGIPLDGIIPASLSISFLGYVNPGNPFFIASAGESSGGRYLDEELVRKYLVPAPQSYSSTAVQQMFSIENGAYTSSTGTTTVPFAGIFVKDFVQGDPSDPSDNRMSDIIWEDITTQSGGSANGANAGTITFVNRYGDTSDFIARVENPWYGEYSASGFLKNGFYINGTEMTPRNSIFDYKIKDRNSFHLYTLSRNFKTSMEYGLEWCKVSNGDYSKYPVVRDFGCGKTSPFEGLSYTVAKSGTEISISSPSTFSIGSLNAGGLAYITAKVYDPNGLYVSLPIGGATFVKCFLTTISGSTGTSSVTQTVNITPNPNNNSNDFTAAAYQAKWTKPSSGGIITGTTLKAATSSSSVGAGYVEIKYIQSTLSSHDQDWYKCPQEQMLYYINSGSSDYTPILYTSYNYAKDRTTNVSYPGAWYRFYIGEYPSNITITAGDSPAISNGKDAFNLSSIKEYDTYPVTIKRNDDNLSYDETAESEFVCNLTGVQGTVVGVNSTGTSTNYRKLAEGSFSSSIVISLPNSATTKTVYIRGNRTPGFVRMTIYPEGKAEQKRTVVAYNRKDFAIQIDGEFCENTVSMQNDMSAGQSETISNWNRWDYTYNKSVKVLPGKICNHCHIGYYIGWGGHVLNITAQPKNISVKSSWASTSTTPALSDVTLSNFTTMDYPTTSLKAGAYVTNNANSPFRMGKMVTSDISIGLLADHKEFGYSYYLDRDPRPCGNTNYYESGWKSRHAYSGLAAYFHSSDCSHIYTDWMSLSALSSKFFYSTQGSNTKAFDGAGVTSVGKNKTTLSMVTKTFRYANDRAQYFTSGTSTQWHEAQGEARLDVASATYDEDRYILRFIIHQYREDAKTADVNSRYWWYSIDTRKNYIIEKYTYHSDW